jgi:hypothetical protein
MVRKPYITVFEFCPVAGQRTFRKLSSEAGQRREVRPSTEGIKFSQETDMQAIAIFIALFTGILLAICLPLILSGKRWRAAEDRAHGRRLADAKMNARLLRLNL